MRRLQLSDMTLCQRPNGAALTFRDKIEFARRMDKLGVDVIETGVIGDPKADALLVRTLASLLEGCTLACTVGRDAASVDQAWQAVQGAKHPRLVVELPVSAVQMEYTCALKPAKMLERITALVSACAQLCPSVEFSAADATRAEPEFLAQAVSAAIEAGADVVTVCDCAGMMMPAEFSAFLTGLYEAAPALSGVTLGVRCTSEIGMSAACAFAAAGCGAALLKAAVTEGTLLSLQTAAQVLVRRGDELGLCSGLDMTNFQRGISELSWMRRQEPENDRLVRPAVPENGRQELTLAPNADIAAFSDALGRLGYTLEADDLARAYDSFCNIAQKKTVSARDLDAIVAGSTAQVQERYRLVSYVINSGNILSPTAHVQLEKDGRVISGLSVGDGPIDAAFLAIEQIVGRHYELDDFQIQAVTEGRDSLGSALVKLRSGGRLYSGQGLSTDIIGASVRAYLHALNKIACEEE